MEKKKSFKKRYKNVAFINPESNTLRQALEMFEEEITKGNLKGAIIIMRHKKSNSVSYSRTGDVYGDNPYAIISTLERIKHQALEIIFEDKGVT